MGYTDKQKKIIENITMIQDAFKKAIKEKWFIFEDNNKKIALDLTKGKNSSFTYDYLLQLYEVGALGKYIQDRLKNQIGGLIPAPFSMRKFIEKTIIDELNYPYWKNIIDEIEKNKKSQKT